MLSALKREEMDDAPKFRTPGDSSHPWSQHASWYRPPHGIPRRIGLCRDWTEASDLGSRLKKLGSEGRWQDVAKLLSSVWLEGH